MRERIRRYIPSFKQRNLDGQGRGSRATFLDATGDERDGTPTANERDMETALARVRQLERRRDKGPAAGQRHRRRNVVVAKRQETESDPTPLPVIVSEIVDRNRPVGVAGATVTVSIGLSLQITTISLEGSTFVSVSSSWFTFDATGGISSAEPTSTPGALTTATTTWTESTSTADSSSPIETSTALTSSSLDLTSGYPTPISPLTTFTTFPTSTSATPAAFDEATVSLGELPVVYPTTLSASMVPSRNMTAHGILRTETTVRKTSTSLETSTTSRPSSRRTSSSTSTSTSTSSPYSSTRISTSIEVAVSTIYPAESEPTTPLDSPTSVESPDAGLGSNSGNQPANENLPPILGGVFGGLAGISLVLWALLFLLRKRRRTSERTVGILGPGTRGGHHRAISAETGAGSVGGMSQARTSLMPTLLGAGGLFGRSSADTAAEPAERGFVKISGRKLPSMYGGDDMVPASIAVANARASVSETGSRNVSGGTHHAGGASSSARGSFYQDDDILHAPTPSPFHPGAARTAMRSGSPAHVSRISEDEPVLAQARRPPPPTTTTSRQRTGGKFEISNTPTGSRPSNAFVDWTRWCRSQSCQPGRQQDIEVH
ncbi:hypothetical protein AOL_s00006g221 [Orbilia oligospora ATCC 24927]|uniref:Uncharacterized protein n=1 Tax=Arthrobotrys oligospora (strain ATCC 24927 / CBS 115.81 / DSM 1491) TaxID=756982 RepID=G1X020_ARTOA|nr:hypothetical protein AOL_s00006g221 [Orbilia oligospora ATCC 24927]EGX53355.1 hypothetical protein AOL_s00006g221 [Orbilia oligospora ATCC 24927]